MDNNKKSASCIIEIAEIIISAVLITLTGLMAGNIVIGIIVSAILQMVSGSFYPALNACFTCIKAGIKLKWFLQEF